MRLFRQFGEVWYRLVDALRDIKPIQSVACLIEDMASQIVGTSGNVLRNSLIILWIQVSSKNEASFTIIKNLIQQCSGKAEKMGITFVAHWHLLCVGCPELARADAYVLRFPPALIRNLGLVGSLSRGFLQRQPEKPSGQSQYSTSGKEVGL